MLVEYAITPQVLDAGSYTPPELCAVYLQQIKEVLFGEALVRDLHGGAWRQFVEQEIAPASPRGRELLKKLVQKRRLRTAPAALPTPPCREADWVEEAVGSHSAWPCAGIVASPMADGTSAGVPVARIDKLSGKPWWRAHTQSCRVRRNTGSYIAALRLLLEHANWLAFVDPHIHPASRNYVEFPDLLKAIVPDSDRRVEVEIHRVVYSGSGSHREFPERRVLQSAFQTWLGPVCAIAQLRINVLLWDDFHDRYLLSDLIHIQVPNGFDIDRADPGAETTWTRVGARDGEDIRREFDPAVHRHKCHFQFAIEPKR